MRWRSRRVPVLLWEETDLESKSFPRKMKKNGRAPPHIPVSRSPLPAPGAAVLGALRAAPIRIPTSRRAACCPHRYSHVSPCPAVLLPSSRPDSDVRELESFRIPSQKLFSVSDCFDGGEPQTGSGCFGFECPAVFFACRAVRYLHGSRETKSIANSKPCSPVPCAEDPSVSREGKFPVHEGT